MEFKLFSRSFSVVPAITPSKTKCVKHQPTPFYPHLGVARTLMSAARMPFSFKCKDRPVESAGSPILSSAICNL
jgi:hypothetical protein